MGNTKENTFLAHKVPFNYALPGQRSDVPSIMQVQTYLGGFTRRQENTTRNMFSPRSRGQQINVQNQTLEQRKIRRVQCHVSIFLQILFPLLLFPFGRSLPFILHQFRIQTVLLVFGNDDSPGLLTVIFAAHFLIYLVSLRQYVILYFVFDSVVRIRRTPTLNYRCVGIRGFRG